MNSVGILSIDTCGPAEGFQPQVHSEEEICGL